MAVVDQYRTARPNESNRERLVTEALMAQTVPADMLRGYRAIPRGELFPQRFGYATEELTVEEVMGMDYVPPSRYPTRYDFTGSPGSFAGTVRTSGTDWW